MPDFDMESSDSDDYNQSDEEVSATFLSEARIKTLTYKIGLQNRTITKIPIFFL